MRIGYVLTMQASAEQLSKDGKWTVDECWTRQHLSGLPAWPGPFQLIKQHITHMCHIECMREV